MNGGFARLPAPPYYAVVFSSQRNAADPAEYAVAAERMLELAQRQPGYLGVESVRGADGFGITVSYWQSEAAIAAWRAQAEHAEIRRHGRRHWYTHYELRVGRIERVSGYAAGRDAPGSAD
ncbi:antibiotic biosynthesis monooxygenase [Pseudoxanthomonas sp. J35]|uniref:antibiotic biosynthesis monooxygenase family protein n=1 Tax=Pseudoxanthomonas sp. J35 TaxID=935852 RepID=UPI00048A5F2C|nr:antibiotic biosynthesis monooxygenase [Pseudoxanthomonas sp. J35]